MQTFSAVIFILSCHSAWKTLVSVRASRAYACEPHNSTELTDCTNQHWIYISSELYAPKLVGGSNCGVNLTECNNLVIDYGLKANCNGPVVNESNRCQEEVDFESVKFVPCLADADDLAVMVEYSCVPRTSILDICSNISHSQTSYSVYLASPGFPHSATYGQMCFCSIQGTKMKMEAIDVNIKANLQWEEPSSSSDSADAVLSIESGDAPVWNSNTHCKGCQSISLHNTYVLSELEGSAVNISLSYADFGLPDQNVWIKVISLGLMLNIDCSSRPLPSNRIITTSTTSTTMTTTTAPPTTVTSTTAPPTTVTSTTAPPTEATTLPTAPRITNSTDNPVKESTQVPVIGTSPPQPTSATSNASGPTTGNIGQRRGKSTKKKDDGGNDDTVIIVVLLLVMVILIAITSVLCVVIYRRRDKFGSIHMKSAVLSWFERTFQRRHHAQSFEDENNEEPPTYDNIIALSSDGSQMEDVQGEDIYAVPMKRSAAKHEPNEPTVSYIRHPDSNAMPKPELDIEENDPGPLIDPGMYASHQQLVGHEVARMKMERSLNSKNKTRDMSRENKHYTNRENTGHTKMTENHDKNKDLAPKIKAKTEPSTDVTSNSAIPDGEEKKETKQMNDAKMHHKKRKAHDKAHSKKFRGDSENERHANVLKLSPEEGQLFEDLGIPQLLSPGDEIKLDENKNKNKIKESGNTAEDNSTDDDENAYSIV